MKSFCSGRKGKGKSRLDSGIVIVVASVLGWGRRRRHNTHSGQQRPNISPPPFPPSLHLQQWGEKEARKCSDVPVFSSPVSPKCTVCMNESSVGYWLLVKSCCRFVTSPRQFFYRHRKATEGLETGTDRAKYEFRLAVRCVESKAEILFQRKLVGLPPLMCKFSHLRRPCGRHSISIRASHSISFSCCIPAHR